MTPKLDLEDLQRRLYGNGAEVWEVEALIEQNERLQAVVDIARGLTKCSCPWKDLPYPTCNRCALRRAIEELDGK